MTIQAIINTAQTMEFDLRKTIGQSISRSQRIKTAQRATAQPFVITIDPIARFRFSETRGILETIVNADRNTETQVYLGSGNLSYINEYRGDWFPPEQNILCSGQPTIVSFTGTTITITSTWDNTIDYPCQQPATPVGVNWLRAGDWIQPANSRYPYIVTADVTTATVLNYNNPTFSTATFTATVHRPIISSEGINVVGQNLLIGNDTTLRVVVSEIPNYRLRNKDWCEFTNDFVLIEKII